MGKSKHLINISVIRGRAVLPSYIGAFQHYFEKSQPEVKSETAATLVAPLDQLDMIAMDLPAHLVNSIESIEVHYEKAK